MNDFRCEKFDSVEGKVICNIAKGCFVEGDCGEFYLPKYNFPTGTSLLGTVMYVPNDVGKLPAISLDAVAYATAA